jgi:nucleoside-diphosphate-sugar epimerase
MKKANHVLITGAAGFLGTAILAQAVASGVSVTATDRIGSAKVSGAPFIPADILNPDSLSKIFKGVDCVCHIAGLAHIFNESEALIAPFHAVNVTGTVNAALAAVHAGVRNFILISSVSVYGPCAGGLFDENSPCHPVGPYAVSKYNSELRAIKIARESGMPLTVLRMATLYGEGDPGNIVRLIQMLHQGRFLWIGDGSNRKSLLYKEDAARACLAVAERPAPGINIYNVSAPPCTMREVVDCIAYALEKRPFSMRVPASLALLVSRHLSRIPTRCTADLHQNVKKWLAEDVYDIHRFEEAYGFQTQTRLKDGLKREVDWYRQKIGHSDK